MLKNIKKDEFDSQVLKAEKVTLVDFYASWCGPCQMLGPVLENIAKNEEDFDIIKVNIDDAQDIAIQYGVEVVPTMLIFKQGQVVGQLVGYADESQITQEVKKYVE